MSLAARYKAVQVETASPPRLMMMLFEGALRNMQKGREAMMAGDHGGAITALERASNIVLEFDTTLKKDLAPDLCEQLHEIYQYVIGRLLVASTGRDLKAIGEAERAFRPIAEAFGQAAAKAASEAGAAR